MARRINAKTIPTSTACREHARVLTRACPQTAIRMNDYGAGGAALFDIVNVQIWTRRRVSAHLQGRYSDGVSACD